MNKANMTKREGVWLHQKSDSGKGGEILLPHKNPNLLLSLLELCILRAIVIRQIGKRETFLINSTFSQHGIRGIRQQ